MRVEVEVKMKVDGSEGGRENRFTTGSHKVLEDGGRCTQRLVKQGVAEAIGGAAAGRTWDDLSECWICFPHSWEMTECGINVVSCVVPDKHVQRISPAL